MPLPGAGITTPMLRFGRVLASVISVIIAAKERRGHKLKIRSAPLRELSVR